MLGRIDGISSARSCAGPARFIPGQPNFVEGILKKPGHPWIEIPPTMSHSGRRLHRLVKLIAAVRPEGV
jgi:hypothetical protein